MFLNLMRKADFFQLLLQRIPRHGMPRRAQELFPYIASSYLNGKPIYGLGLNKRNQKYADDIYRRLDDSSTKAINQIRMVLLKKATGVMAGPLMHPMGLTDDIAFADTMIRYCTEFIGNKRETVVRGLAKTVGVHVKFLKKKKLKDDKEELERIANEPSFYNFLFDNIMNEGD